MEYGHWELLCEELNDWESFVYEIIDENDKRYIGAKTRIKGWETYTSSSKPLKKAIADGLNCRYTILKFFAASQEAFDYEDELLVKYNCVKSDNYWNLSRSGKEFNICGCGDKRRGENNPLFKGWYIIDGIKYASQKEAAVAIGCDASTILYRVNSGSFPEYVFMDAQTLELRPKSNDKHKHKRGTDHPKFKGWYIIHGERYSSLNEAANALGVSRVTIYHRIKSDNYPEYIFLPVSDN